MTKKNKSNARTSCFECGSRDDLHDHHVVPRSLGGKRTVSLCQDCHWAVHSKGSGPSIRKLTKQALAQKQARGEWVGGAPFGYKVENGKLAKGDKWFMASTVVDYRNSGWKLREIVERMETMFPGEKWSITKVSRILSREGVTKSRRLKR